MSERKWRKIYYHLFNSERIQTLSTKGLAIYTACLIGADKFGRIYADPAVFKATCLSTMKHINMVDCKTGLTECEKCGLLIKYEVAGVCFYEMSKWADHQGDRTGRWGQTAIPNPDGSDANQSYIAPDNTPIATPTPIATAPKRQPKQDYSNQIDELAEIYRQHFPTRMVGLGKWKKWGKQELSSPDLISDYKTAIINYSKDCRAKQVEDRYTKHIYNFRQVWQDWLTIQTADTAKPKGLTIQQQIRLLEDEVDDKRKKIERGYKFDLQPIYEKIEKLKSQEVSE